MNVLVIGNGLHTNKRIIPALLKILSIKKITVASRNIQKKSINDRVEFESIEDFLGKNKTYDLGLIVTPPSSHIELYSKIKNCCNRVLIEKPLSDKLNLDIGINLYDLVNNGKIYESLMYFHHPVWLEVKNIISEFDIVKIKTEFSVPHTNLDNFRYSKILGGGSLLDQGIYPVSLVSQIVKEEYEIKRIKLLHEDDYEVDLGGEIEVLVDKKIKFVGIWKLGGEYKNYLKLITSSGEEFFINFFFSKPDDKEIIIEKNGSSYKIFEPFDQFKQLYIDALSDQKVLKEYSNLKNLLKRYEMLDTIYKNFKK